LAKEKVKEKEEELEEEEEEEEEEAPAPKKKIKKEEGTPEWAKQIIKLLTPQEQTEAPKTIPVPKAPAKEEDPEKKTEKLEDQKQPSQTFLNWFW
jgi:hypothetical protein